MYGLNGRDAEKEMKKRYSIMVNVLSDILNCGSDEIEELFDSKNNIEAGEIIKRHVEECGCLPEWNTVYLAAMLDFAGEHGLKMGVDVSIYTNGSRDTHIYAREGLDEEIVRELEDLFNMAVETAAFLGN